ncbi:hypothetical protein FB451DRAFT_1188845 [Mycena latifolia]|nr:hypothetical protein FB451DRAFT_1195114 [Mycena latifolia]KAJ7446080.1 hypothetical protein FB451DRAFT_1188845 [Mycena latifolia]
MPLYRTATQIRLNNIITSLDGVLSTVEVLGKSLQTPFLEPISNTIRSLLISVQTIRKNKDDCTQMLEQIHELLYAIISLHTNSETGAKLSPDMFDGLGKFTEYSTGATGIKLSVLANLQIQGFRLLSEVTDLEQYAQKTHQEVLELVSAISDWSDGVSSQLSCVSFSSTNRPEARERSHPPSYSIFLQPPSFLVDLDNLETIWEPRETRKDLEQFLSLLTDVDHLALIITMHGAERPANVRWTRPFLEPLKPLRQEAARKTFIDIVDEGHTGGRFQVFE